MSTVWFGLMVVLASQSQAPVASEKQLARLFGERSGCFVLYDVENRSYVRYDASRCATRFSPCSTFKIANSLIGLDSGVVTDDKFTLPWDGVRREVASWNRDHDLRSAFQNSVVWYYQRIAERVGAERMQGYLERFQYGNQDLSAGLTQFWLGSSLAISADEQVVFLGKLLSGALPVSERARDLVMNLMIVEQNGDVILRGKTGTGRGAATSNLRAATDGSREAAGNSLGWFVGFVTRGARHYIFATNLEGTDVTGMRARDITRAILAELQLFPAPRQG